MADNIDWIKDKYPKGKIICWGATSHFLYNSKEVRMKDPAIQLLAGSYYKKHRMMGDYLKDKYKEKVYTVGFTAYSGRFGLFSNKKLKEPKQQSVESLLGRSENKNIFLPLNNLNLDGYLSRPVGNMYMKNPVNNVMDAIVFNRTMRRPKFDKDFMLELYPNHKYIRPDIEE
jgi:erythromycin esterase-like protein